MNVIELPDISSIQGHYKIGGGYNVMQDAFVCLTIFERINEVVKDGFTMPEGYNLEMLNDSKTVYTSIETNKALAKFRLQRLSLESEVDSRLIPAILGNSGFGNFEETKTAVHLLTHQLTLFKVSLADLDKLGLSSGFEADVEQKGFPENYSGTEDEKAFFSGFFEKWGSHLVGSAAVGGMLELSMASKRSTEQGTDFNEAENGLHLAFRKISEPASQETPAQAMADETPDPEKSFGPVQLRLIGGDSKFKLKSVEAATPESWMNWLKSVHSHPVVLEAGMRLIPIHDVIEKISPAKAKACKNAADDLFGVMEVVKDPTHPKVEEAETVEEEKEEVMTVTVLPQHAVNQTQEAHHASHQPQAHHAVQQSQEAQRAEHPKSRENAAETAETRSSGGCFPGTSTVQIRNRSEAVLMSDLRVGDQVLCFDVANNEAVFSEVFMMAHINPDAKAQFLKVTG